MKIMKFDESVDNWTYIKKHYINYVERTNNELDYDEYFKYMKKLVNDDSLPWKDITKKYYHYVERTNNELDSEQYFREFKKIVSSFEK